MNKKIKISDLKHKISVQSIGYKPDNLGNIVRFFEDICEIWASIDLVKDTAEDQENGNVHVYVFKIRYNDQVSVNNIIKYQEHFYEILSIEQSHSIPKYMIIKTHRRAI